MVIFDECHFELIFMISPSMVSATHVNCQYHTWTWYEQVNKVHVSMHITF